MPNDCSVFDTVERRPNIGSCSWKKRPDEHNIAKIDTRRTLSDAGDRQSPKLIVCILNIELGIVEIIELEFCGLGSELVLQMALESDTIVLCRKRSGGRSW